ncbi:MAG: protein kinase [Candidatus Endonucleobacter sp. (ex Gigantidas childressi)]|nr:protein kinase [Candidatus Endonucleobacter sp. (ex Gigantidas childressi)]
MYLLSNGLKLFCSLLVAFTVSELVASTATNIINAKNAIIFIKKEPVDKFTHPVTLRIAHGVTIFFDDNQVKVMSHNSLCDFNEICFSSGEPIYIFFHKSEGLDFPDIENADNYYVFNLTNHAQKIVSDGDSGEEDEIFQTLVAAHPMMHIYNNNRWVVVAENHLIDHLAGNKHDLAASYLSTVFSHTRWPEGVSDQIMNHVKHRTHSSSTNNKTNELCYRYSETFNDGFIVIDPVCKKEISSESLSAEQFFSGWTSRPSTTIKPGDDITVEFSNLILSEGLTESNTDDSTNTKLTGRSEEPRDCHSFQMTDNKTLSHLTHGPLYLDLPSPTIHCPVDNLPTINTPTPDKTNSSEDAFTQQIPGTLREVAERNINPPPSHIITQRPCQNSPELLISNPLFDHDLKEALNKLTPLRNQNTLQLRGKKYTQTHLIARSSEGPVHLCVDEKGEYTAIKRIFKPIHYLKKQSECRETALLKSGQLEHPFAMHFIDIYTAGDFEYQVMPYLPRTIFELRRNQSEWPVEKSWLILKQLLTVISFYHNNSITHRDIKPKNILLSNDGTKIQVIDFGSSKKVQASGMTQSIFGTVEFVIPTHALAYRRKESVSSFYADLAAAAITMIYMETANTIFKRPENNNKLKINDLYDMLIQTFAQLGWTDKSSVKEIETYLAQLFSKYNRVADDRLLGLLAKMLAASSADKTAASELLSEYFPDQELKGKHRIAVQTAPYQKIKNYFISKGIAVENVAADGNCLYNAIALSMEKNLTNDEYNHILIQMPRIEGEDSTKISNKRLRRYLHNFLSEILYAIDQVANPDKRKKYQQQLTSILGEEYQLLQTMVTDRHIFFAAHNATQTHRWGDGSIISTLLVLSFNLNTRIETPTGTIFELASFSALKEQCEDLMILLQKNSVIPTYYRDKGWLKPIMLVFSEGNHYLAAYPVASSKTRTKLALKQ